jgi:uncharacterized protein
MPHINKQMASFFLTTKCNLRCVYCYNSKERAALHEQSLPLHIAKAGVDYFFSTNSSRHIRFYGPGEPTQEFALMKNIVKYAKEKVGEELSVEIQTNGCFESDVREWLLNNVNIIWVSFDGEPNVQNKNRPLPNNKPSAPLIEDNVKWLLKNANTRNFMVGARVTMTDDNNSRQKQIIDYFYSLGIRYVWTDPIFPAVDSVPVCDDYVKQQSYHFDMENYANNYLDAYKYAQTKGVFYGSFLTCNFDGKSNKHCRSCTPTPHFTPDGFISACDLVTSGANAHHMDVFVYGNWDEKKQKFIFDSKKIENLQNRSTENMVHCKLCDVKDYCGGYCLGEVMNETGSLFGQKTNSCKAIKMLYRKMEISTELFPYMHP